MNNTLTTWDRETQLTIVAEEVLVVVEEFEELMKVVFFTDEGSTEGYIKKGKTRKLEE